MGSEPKWRRFEKLVAQIQRELAPDAVVLHDDRIKGHISGRPRQIDITVKQKVGQYDILIAIDCKDCKRSVNVGEVGQFIELIKDIRANKGVMVAANGFSGTAKRVGEEAGLDLYRLVDTEAHNWQTYVSIPVICDFRGIQKYQFSIPNSVATFLPSMDPNEIIVYDTSSPQRITIVDLLKTRWNSGKLPREPGEHRDILLTRVITAFTRDEAFRADVLAHIVVERRLFFGHLPLTQLSGFRDESTGRILTPSFTTDWLNAADVERNWRQLESIDEIAVEPILKLVAFDKYDIPQTP